MGLLNLKKSNWNIKKIFNAHPFLSSFGLSGILIVLTIFIKSLFLAPDDTAFGNYFMGMVFFGAISVASFIALFKEIKYDTIKEQFSQMNPDEAKQAIENLQKTVLVYLLGVEKNLFYLSACLDTNDTEQEAALKKTGALIQVAKWGEAFYLKLENIQANSSVMDHNFYLMVVEMQNKLKTKKVEISSEILMELEVNWQNQTQQIIFDELKRYSDYHFRSLEAIINKREVKEEVVSSEGLFNSTKKYLKNTL